jgi:hypothetical protein
MLSRTSATFSRMRSSCFTSSRCACSSRCRFCPHSAWPWPRTHLCQHARAPDMAADGACPDLGHALSDPDKRVGKLAVRVLAGRPRGVATVQLAVSADGRTARLAVDVEVPLRVLLAPLIADHVLRFHPHAAVRDERVSPARQRDPPPHTHTRTWVSGVARSSRTRALASAIRRRHPVQTSASLGW